MTHKDWTYVKVTRQELIALANAGQHKGSTKPLGGDAIAVYLYLRGRIYEGKKGERKFYTFPSHKAIEQGLGWDNAPEKRIQKAVTKLKKAKIIKVIPWTDQSKAARQIRKMIGNIYHTATYDLLLWRKCHEELELKQEGPKEEPVGSYLEKSTVLNRTNHGPKENRKVNKEKNKLRNKESAHEKITLCEGETDVAELVKRLQITNGKCIIEFDELDQMIILETLRRLEYFNLVKKIEGVLNQR